ncbi:MAG TPA: sulfite exporter TauE/SafE family protein [Planctomycetes bacterium]|nr:sulfite exporter TauE/SafE family protein [Planctomycetota bacterium]
MTSELFHAVGAAFWLGILTSISPCPLAANVAAVSFLARAAPTSRAALVPSLLYTLGRALTYSALAALLTWSVLSIPALSGFLQGEWNRILGPLLILVGLILVGWLPFPRIGWTPKEGASLALVGKGGLGSLLLGMVLALSFCPISAALFFGSLIPLAAKTEHMVLMPLTYGLATAIPVIVFAVALGWSARAIDRLFARTLTLSRWLQQGTGWVFIGVGVFMSLVFDFRVL